MIITMHTIVGTLNYLISTLNLSHVCVVVSESERLSLFKIITMKVLLLGLFLFLLFQAQTNLVNRETKSYHVLLFKNWQDLFKSLSIKCLLILLPHIYFFL